MGHTPRLDRIDLPHGHSSHFSYDTAWNDHRLTRIEHRFASGAVLAAHDCGHDPDGTITRWTQERSGQATRSWHFGYDLNGNLVERSGPDGFVARGGSPLSWKVVAGRARTATDFRGVHDQGPTRHGRFPESADAGNEHQETPGLVGHAERPGAAVTQAEASLTTPHKLLRAHAVVAGDDAKQNRREVTSLCGRARWCGAHPHARIADASHAGGFGRNRGFATSQPPHASSTPEAACRFRSNAQGFHADELRFSFRFAVFQRHGDHFAEGFAEFLNGLPLRVRTGMPKFYRLLVREG